MQDQIIRMQTELNHYQGETQRLQNEVDRLKRLREEYTLMQSSENLKVIRDN